MLISQRKLNETAEHYELKQVAKYILWSRGYTIIGTEVSGFYDAHLRNDGFPEGCAHKNTIDTVGIRAQGWEAGSVRSIGIYGIEAKASLLYRMPLYIHNSAAGRNTSRYYTK
jgi:hypothetical protein